ncbi:MAG: polyketide synthase, partial [Gammaproteobacteria bacterium]|nr:polyketide synthase [Gammaproteobacteria bacterium]
MNAPKEKAQTTEQESLIDQLMLEKYEPIAIVGIGLRFPGNSSDLDTFSQLLADGKEGITPIPQDRWDNDKYYDALPGVLGKNCTHSGGFVNALDQFDAKFFAISPKEANNMDPQQRMMLELSWESLENACINPDILRGGNASVYIGVGSTDFAKDIFETHGNELQSQMATGAANSAIAGRLSYFLGLRGPCMILDTACSSSLVALHLAANALRNKETDLSLCGAISLIHHPSNHIALSQANMLSPDGRCKTFDNSADGYGRSEGGAILVLKRLSDALKDKNNIVAILRGSAVLQDGESAGLTVPNGEAQEQVMRKVLSNAIL